MISIQYIANALPALPVALPLLTAALLSAARARLPRAAMDGFALVASACNVADCVLLLFEAHRHTIVYWFARWGPGGWRVVAISFGIDPGAAGVPLLCSVLRLLALLFSWNHTDSGGNY